MTTSLHYAFHDSHSRSQAINRACSNVCLILAAILSGAAAQAAQAADKPVFHWLDDEKAGTAQLDYGPEPVLRYMYAYDPSTPERLHETYKVYHHVFGPGAGEIITKGPGGEYTHHRGLFIGFRKTEYDGTSIDSWHCPKGVHQRHVRFLDKSGNAQQGTMTAEIHWNDADGKPVITETRTVTVSLSTDAGPQSHAWQIDWSTSLASNRGEVTLDGDRQHAGFQFRAAQAVAEQKNARYIRPAGFPQQPEAFEVDDKGHPPRHINLGWTAMYYTLGDKQYTVEYFEDPALPKPSLFSERPYGRFGAFVRLTVKPDQPLGMHYRLRVSSGSPPTQAEIQKRYDAFVSEMEK